MGVWGWGEDERSGSNSGGKARSSSRRVWRLKRRRERRWEPPS